MSAILLTWIIATYFVPKPKQETPINNLYELKLIDDQLIEVNDSLYQRINVRIDTTYFKQ